MSKPAARGKTAGRERLHKFLASTGAGSRRECETYITEGRVSVNGRTVTKLGSTVDPSHDKVMFDGEVVKAEKKVYWLLNKPPGTICTNSDERGRMRVVDLVPDKDHRIYTVGRLDAESRGLILLTNDGTIANIICHPRYRIEKVYQVAVRGTVDRQQIARVEAGVWLAEGKSSPARVRPVARNARRDETLIEMTVYEGRNREVRRVLAKVGLTVRRLQRARIGPLDLGNLAPGQARKLDPEELEFVHEAEQLYLANKEAWDAELPVEKRPSKPGRGPRGGVGGKNRKSGGPGQGRTSADRRSQARGPGSRGPGGRGPGGQRSGGGGRGRQDSGPGARRGGRPEGGRGPSRDSSDRPTRTRRYYD